MHHGQYAATLGMVLCCLLSAGFSTQTSALQGDTTGQSLLAAGASDVNEVETVVFSQSRGFYSQAFYLILTTDTDDATVYYTTDGGVPNPDTANIALEHNQAFPLIISETTCVRAMAVKAGFTPSEISTHTYIFPRDVISAPDDPDPALIEDALLALPTVVLATDSVPVGSDMSSLTSVEWVMPDYTQGFQVSASLSQRAQASVKLTSGKTSFHVDFDDTPVDYPLFDTPSRTSHRGFDLVTPVHDSWQSGARDYASQIRDVFSHDLQALTGQPSLLNRFCHVYINAQYRGLYQMQEQVDALARRTNPDVPIESLDVLQTVPDQGSTLAMLGTRDALDRLYAQMQAGFDNMARYYRVQGMEPDGQHNADYERLLDVDNLIDFMIVEYFTGDTNGPGSRLNQGRPNHIVALYNRTRPDGFKWVQYNNEWSLGTGDVNAPGASQGNMVAPPVSATMTDLARFSCHVLHEHLMAFNSDYRMRFVDTVYEHFFNTGIMAENPTRALIQTRANQIQIAMIAEAARWGSGPQSRLTWLAEIDRLQFGTQDHQNQPDARLLTRRAQTVLAQFKASHWYPDVAVPVISQPSSLVLPGSSIAITAAQGILYLTLDGTDPRASGGSMSPSAQVYAGPLPISETTQIKARAKVGSTWSALSHATFTTQDITDKLRLSEMMPDPNVMSTDYIELMNMGTQSIDLSQVRLSDAVNFTFPAMTLAPNARVLVVQDKAAFEAYYGTGRPVAGQYAGVLSGPVERLVVHDSVGQVIHDFSYDTTWYDITHGQGFSLTVKPDAFESPHSYGDAASWRPSQTRGGSPGLDEIIQIPARGAIIINEVLSHSHDIASDWVELYNTSDDRYHLGGWFLSDNPKAPQKYEIAYGTIIEPRGYLVLFEVEHFGNPFNPGTHEPFALSENGETLYVYSGLDGALTGLQMEETLGASNTGVSFGRYQKSTGTENLVFMSQTTPGRANSTPLVGPVVISEIMYHPSSHDDAEYVELTNISDQPVLLFDPIEYLPWRFQDNEDGSGISLYFPMNPALELQPGEHVVMVKDTNIFHSNFDVPDMVNVLEWPSGKLSNSGERIQLDQPGDVDLAGKRYWIRTDRVDYSDGSHPDNSGVDLWPAGPDGRGWSLQRIELDEYGNDPINWQAGMPTPGW
ncbi:MAG: hypothetical protein GY809_30510 [Planctomycetes bacterium]|nr:hypothetical protein [Planctomycetota bacterium]